jgi:hypothetical protein
MAALWHGRERFGEAKKAYRSRKLLWDKLLPYGAAVARYY